VIDASGIRIGWSDLPQRVRRAVEEIIGDRVVEAVSQRGGFSPGTADRVRTVTGRRAFVKAVSPAQNADSPAMHRREARITAALPAEAPVPRLLGCHDDGYWVALVLEDVPGRQPATPWLPDELTAVLATLDELAERLTPCAVPGLPTAAERLAVDLTGWHRIRAEPPADLDPWLAGHLDELCRLADRGLAALTGDTLTHTDLRADNLLISDDGSVTLVDWPWACLGPAWLDTLLLLINVRLFGDRRSEQLLALRPTVAGVDPLDLTGALAGLAGFFLDGARRPPPPGLPTLRAFQHAQAEVTISWLRERW
jgi:aminoglycoside phosphotransferase (APT) family kinase protein